MHDRISAAVLTRFWRSAVPLGLAALALIVASELSAQTTGRASMAAAPLPPLTDIEITSDRDAPQALGMPIMFRATSNERTGSVQYQWLVFTHGWHVVQAWSTSDSFAWTPTTASASYRIGVWARYAGSTADGPDTAQARSIVAFPIVASAPAGVDAAIVADGPAGVDTASVDDDPAEVVAASVTDAPVGVAAASVVPEVAGSRINAQANGALAVPIQAWIPDGVLDVTLPEAASLSSGETAATVVPASPGADVPVEPATEPAIDAVDTDEIHDTATDSSASPAANVAAEVVVPVHPDSTGGADIEAQNTSGGAPRFQGADDVTKPEAMSLPAPRGATSLAKDDIAPSGPVTTFWVSHPGTRTVASAAGRRDRSQTPPDINSTAGTSAAGTAAPEPSAQDRPLRVTQLTADRVAPQAPDVPITFPAETSGGTGPVDYQWRVFTDDWRVAQPWSASASFTWTPTSASADYRIGVRVRSAGGTADARDNDHASGTLAFPIAGGS